MGNRRVENSALNLLKLFACCSVVFMHVKFPGRFGEVVNDINYAVPVFLMIAGYSRMVGTPPSSGEDCARSSGS